jgi:hypothetical protein
MAFSKYKPNLAFPKQQSVEPEMLAAFALAAEGIAESIRMNAPIQTGRYKRSIKVTQAPTQVTVGSHDFAGHIIEWGSVKTPALAPIRRGVLAAGLRLDEISR